MFQAVLHSLKPHCKCHGVSGSCTDRTCWSEISDFHTIGTDLKKRHRRAVKTQYIKRRHVLMVKNQRQSKIRNSDLVYTHPSPQFCKRSKIFGVRSTRGRECSRDHSSPGSCKRLCCGRGHTTTKQTIVEQCDCTFQWCCSVKCRTCKRVVKKHFCL